MKPYLYNVAKRIYHRYSGVIDNCTFVFPNRRAGVFFRRYLGEIVDKPIFSPNVITISELFEGLTSYTVVDRVEQLFIVYKYFIKYSNRKESFDDFIYWGEILINDFNDIDKNLVDAERLFANVKDIKDIDETFGDPFTPEQREFLKRFYNNFNDSSNSGSDELSTTKKNFISIWSILYNIYSSVREELHSVGKASEGMILRDVAERAQNNQLEIKDKKIIFIGFNLLSRAEEILFTYLKREKIGDFYWDNNTPTLRDNYNKANTYIKENIKNYPSQCKIEEPLIDTYPEIEVIGVSSNIGQAKYAGKLLDGLKNEIKGSNSGINTAVILPDEKLLMPMLYSIPQEITPINVTMGYPLSETTLAGFFLAIFELHKRVQKRGDTNYSFFYKGVLVILEHPYVVSLYPDEAKKLRDNILTKNIVYIDGGELKGGLSAIFKAVTTLNNAYEYLNGIIDMLCHAETKLLDGGALESGISQLESEFLYHYKTTLNRLYELAKGQTMSAATLFALLQKSVAFTKVPFRGEPLSGLQIMGILETRALDFENVIILSMNDGVFPSSSSEDSYIPKNLRRGFGLSTSDHVDSITAYYFYRLIARAKRLYIIYDTRTEGGKSGEVSRYVKQLKYHYLGDNPKAIKETVVSYRVEAKEEEAIEIAKSSSVLESLNAYKRPNCKALSASALNTYIDCPLKFYFNYVERIREEDKVSEDLDASMFGSIYHGAMQSIYTKYIGRKLDAAKIDTLIKDDKNITDIINKQFAEIYYGKSEIKKLTGKLFLKGEIIRKMVKRTLELDKQRPPFTIVSLEGDYSKTIPLNNNEKVNLKGIIDRVDRVDRVDEVDRVGNDINIIDYKSGRDDLFFTDIKSLFSSEGSNRNKAVFQLFIYAILHGGCNINDRLIPGIYLMSRFYDKQGFKWRVSQKGIKGIEELSISGSSETLLVEFTASLTALLSDIFNSEISFKQTTNRDKCKYCDFAPLCRR